jgi:hypothetical protein
VKAGQASRQGTKSQAYDWVKKLRLREFSTSQIAEAMRYTPQRIGQMLVELGLHKPRRFATTAQAVQSLTPGEQLELEAFRGENFQVESESQPR